jgi:sulfate transport system ATP-binding protein
MDFLGNVNKLPVRVEGGKALLGESGTVEVPAKLFGTGENGRIDAYIRPHELDISRTADGGNCLLAKVLHINPAGSVVKVRLMAEDFGLVITVDITPDRYKSLALKSGDTVYVTPKAGKFFEPDYTI